MKNYHTYTHRHVYSYNVLAAIARLVATLIVWVFGLAVVYAIVFMFAGGVMRAYHTIGNTITRNLQVPAKSELSSGVIFVKGGGGIPGYNTMKTYREPTRGQPEKQYKGPSREHIRIPTITVLKPTVVKS